jgi:hypothetical protein
VDLLLHEEIFVMTKWLLKGQSHLIFNMFLVLKNRSFLLLGTYAVPGTRVDQDKESPWTSWSSARMGIDKS